jgi:hypothetical protein
MSVTHLKFKINPEKIPPGLLGKLLELYNPEEIVMRDHAFGPEYFGWIQFHSDGTIEIGEPGE